MLSFTKKRLILFSATPIFLGLMIFVCVYSYFHNFSVVIPNQVYRSNSLSENEFARVVKRYHIRSVINLRGPNPKQIWYQTEIKNIALMNIQHYDIALQSKTMPPLPTLKNLAEILEHAPKPVLLHCLSGVDRTGMAAEVALILADVHDPLTIARQGSWRYFVFSQKSIAKQFWRDYQRWLREQHQVSSKENFYRWLDTRVDGVNYPH